VSSGATVRTSLVISSPTVLTRRAYYALAASREIAESSELGVLRKHVLKVALLAITTMLAVAFVAYGFLDPRIRL